ncbi:hypothetical protein BLNAU_699 [Blattamonas nauphoetae]|uniref:EF-hand domain-containing protein n=1 Tax=Blattamonas nauphoetae TaxID=2049346 RepID=A0ABQ9YK91_9EUKA|nr:hypothetical protein BLNAU_699 [Blattamonas nauphoetae]
MPPKTVKTAQASPMRAPASSKPSSKKITSAEEPIKAAPPHETPKEEKEDDEGFSDLTDEELLELFAAVDADGGGTLDREELKEVMMKLKVASSEAEMERIINSIDEDGNGEIDPEEFIEGFRRAGKCKYTADEVQHAFKVMSKTDPRDELRGTGTISVECMVQFIQKFLPETKEEEELLEMMGALPIDKKTKTFSYESFISTMIN